MNTIWTGKELILRFDSGQEINLSITETKEFEKWFLSKVENKVSDIADKER